MSTNFDYRRIFKSEKIPTSLVKLADLKRLHADLIAPSHTAAELLTNNLTKPDNQSDEDFEKTKQDLLALARPVIRISGSNGEQASGCSIRLSYRGFVIYQKAKRILSWLMSTKYP